MYNVLRIAICCCLRCWHVTDWLPDLLISCMCVCPLQPGSDMAKAEVLWAKRQKKLAARQARIKHLQMMQLKRQQRLAARRGKRMPQSQKVCGLLSCWLSKAACFAVPSACASVTSRQVRRPCCCSLGFITAEGQSSLLRGPAPQGVTDRALGPDI